MQRIFPAEAAEWDRLILNFPDAHILQSWEWAQVKRMNGWNPVFLQWVDEKGNCAAAACIHVKKVPVLGAITGSCLMYSPRGPLVNWKNNILVEQVIGDLQVFAREEHAIFLKIDPAVAGQVNEPVNDETPNLLQANPLQDVLKERGWIYSQDQLQFRNTVLLDLKFPEDTILERMKQKTRYNIRLAIRKGVEISPASEGDLDELYRQYAETATRDGFVIRTREYYLSVWRNLMEAGIAYPLVARYQQQIISGLILFVFGETGYYFYGMSTDQYRDVMPNYLLQWEAIKLAKSKGCTTYDFWGAPDTFTPEDRMNGVYRFKEGFNGHLFLGLGAWDFPASQFLYQIYTRVLPTILNWMRSGARKRIAREVNA